ncbi:P-loop containing nucleoside triphosphate hydrolase protein, partial [Suillus paluster]|uniref:P-loop containing nucleoside triphosphate hydrolase protein n=1 Tax=Suillus paluster TaxID=48578 RepID=UPI001B87DB04
SLAEWDKVRSSKVDTLVTLLGWQLESDDHHVFQVEDDDASTEAGESAKVLSPPPASIEKDAQPRETPTLISPKPNARYVPMKDLMTKGTRKILVYIEFPMMAPLLVSVLKLFNIIPLVIHGGHGIEERNETVQKFHSDPKARLLIFSSVGAVGLNLTAASIVILFDQCWSRMLVNQIIGRAWRLGQQREVIVYNMVALGTVDVLMVDHGEGKGNMLGQFLSAHKGKRR